MNWAQLIQDLKICTSTENFDNISDEKYELWLSKSQTKFAEKVKSKIDSKFFMGISQAALVAGQAVYDKVWEENGNGKYINVVDALYVKYDGTHPVKLDLLDFTDMNQTRDWLAENQSEDNPFFTMSWQKIILFPTPKIDVSQEDAGIEIVGSRRVSPITKESTEAEILNWVLADEHDMIVLGAKQYVYEFLKEMNNKNDAIVEYERELSRCIAELSYRGSQPVWYEEDEGEINKLLNM